MNAQKVSDCSVLYIIYFIQLFETPNPWQGSKIVFEGTCPAGQVLSNSYSSFEKSTCPSLLE